jgi:hypothetical protein
MMPPKMRLSSGWLDSGLASFRLQIKPSPSVIAAKLPSDEETRARLTGS